MFKKQTKEKILLYPTDGTLIPQGDIPDEAFASGMLGVGFAVLPDAGTVYAPISGTVESIADAHHAYTILGEDGTELLVHIGIDTVTLRGEGFVPMVDKGAHVHAGEVLARVNLALLRQHELNTHTVVLITNAEHIKKMHLGGNKGLGGKSEGARYETV